MRDVPLGGDSWRRDDRARPLRRSPPPPRRPSPLPQRRSPPRRSPPPPRRFSPRRNERDRDRDRERDRPRSPRRGFDPRLNPLPQPDNPNHIPLTSLPHRRRSRTPPALDRDRVRDRSPPPRRPSPPPAAAAPPPRANTYRGEGVRGGRSRSPDRLARLDRPQRPERPDRFDRPERRGDDRFNPTYPRRPSPPRDSVNSSAMASRDTSRRSTPHPEPPRREERSPRETPLPTRPVSRSSHGGPGTIDRSPQKTPQEPQPQTQTQPQPQPQSQSTLSRASRSPPRGPAALRVPPTGPRDSRGHGNYSAGAIGPPARPAAVPSRSPSASRQDHPTGAPPPSGPRGFTPGRGGGYGRGGRGGGGGGGGGPGWGNGVPNRNAPISAGPASASTPPAATTGSNNIPTGPRGSISSQSGPPAPVAQAKGFNPPKGPAAETNHRPSLAQQLLASMPPLIPGGKMDPSYIPITTGVLPELQAHMDRLKEEEEKLREEKYAKEEKLRKSLAAYEKGERETKVMALRTELAEQSLKKFAGEGLGGAAF
ncbi:hypothetical protein GGS20DRAFT_363490 [Poronia punctata]|nr:hypothetical protein GGS20DRAFT_363490 [Poronia punctata]